jgi:tetratricopeptide (TPR) repeat protein
MLDASTQAQPYMQAGAALYQNRDLEGARQAFKSALAVQPDLTPAKFNLAVIYREWEHNETALALFREVIDSGEIVAEAVNNLGILAVRREAFTEAVEHFREAIRLRSDFPLAHFNLGTLLLRLGQWEEGWREHEWRWQTPTFVPVKCPQPQWDGQTLDGTLLLHTEQGIGDVFQFARFVPQIRQRCRRVMFLLPEHLQCMFTAPQWADEVRTAGEIGLNTFDAVLPLMSAPFVLQTKLEDLPLQQNYLTPQPRTIDLDSQPTTNRKVGITWGGSPTHVNDAFRSMKVAEWLPLLQIPLACKWASERWSYGR